MAEFRLSIQIPTLNSGRTLQACVESLGRRLPFPVELIVVDGGSSDATLEIARSAGARIIVEGRGLLYSRVAGILASRGDWTLLLDSDQEVVPGALNRIPLDSSYDAFVLEERSFEPQTILERLYESDRVVSGMDVDLHDPTRGISMPRLFRTSVIKKAVANIPSNIGGCVRYPDHAILHFEVSLLTDKVGFVPDFLVHHENSSLLELLKKHYKYGIDAAIVSKVPRYSVLVRTKSSALRPMPEGQFMPRWVEAEILMVLKGIPFLIGYASFRRQGQAARIR